MEECTIAIKKSNDEQHYLVVWRHSFKKTEFVVCSYYNQEAKIGSQWDWGHYFRTLDDALEYWNEEQY